jgi:hypothetical protein
LEISQKEQIWKISRSHYEMTNEDLTLQSQKGDVQIRLRRGEWEIEITCGKDKVKDVVRDVLFGIDISIGSNELAAKVEEALSEITDLKSKLAIGTEKLGSEIYLGRPNEAKQLGATCRGLIWQLCYEGYFEQEKSLGQVHEELSRRGYNYDRTAVSHSLTDMVREGSLRRIGTIRSYRYVQKSKLMHNSENMIGNS